MTQTLPAETPEYAALQAITAGRSASAFLNHPEYRAAWKAFTQTEAYQHEQVLLKEAAAKRQAQEKATDHEITAHTRRMTFQARTKVSSALDALSFVMQQDDVLRCECGAYYHADDEIEAYDERFCDETCAESYALDRGLIT